MSIGDSKYRADVPVVDQRLVALLGTGRPNWFASSFDAMPVWSQLMEEVLLSLQDPPDASAPKA